MKRKFFLPLLTTFFFFLSFSFSLAHHGPFITVDILQKIHGEKDVVVIDAREPEFFARGHISGAVNIWHEVLYDAQGPVRGMLAPIEKLELLLASKGIRPASVLYVYDSGDGKYASRIVWILDYLGHKKKGLVAGGIASWRKKGLPLARGAEPLPARARYTAHVDPSVLATKEYVRKVMENRGVVLIDTRSQPEYAGLLVTPGIERKGRIPGARHVDWLSQLTPERNNYVSREKLQALYTSQGALPEKEIIVYCSIGLRSSSNYFVLKYLLDYPNVRVYDGSMYEWGREADLPLE